MKSAKQDEELQAEVIEELQVETHVRAAHIGVSAEHGAVTLTGEVGSDSERMAAIQAAKRVVGVLAVADDIQVRIADDSNPTDTDVAIAVVRAFDRLNLAEGNVKIDVIDHVVLLTGDVRRTVDRTVAEEAALQIPGVMNVINKIVVGPPATEHDVRTSIMDAFVSAAARQAGAINVHSTDGHVVLSGSVPSLVSRNLADEAAWVTPGVRSVKNHLHVHA